MEEERITRIARAMCRAARLDPDKPVAETAPDTDQAGGTGAESAAPTWTLFRQEAMSFALRHRDIVAQL